MSDFCFREVLLGGSEITHVVKFFCVHGFIGSQVFGHLAYFICPWSDLLM